MSETIATSLAVRPGTQGVPPILVRHPQPDDLVDDPVHVAGIGSGFEGVLGARVRDRAGNVLVQVAFHVGGTGIWGNFALALRFGTPPATTRGAVEVFESSSDDGSDLNLQVVPVVFGPALIQPFHGFAEHTVVGGDSLFSIATTFYGDGDRFPIIFDANRDLLDDPDRISPGQVLRIPQ